MKDLTNVHKIVSRKMDDKVRKDLKKTVLKRLFYPDFFFEKAA